MHKMTRRAVGVKALGAATLALLISASAASAQQPIRLRGTITAVDGPVLTVKARDGAMLKVKVADNAVVRAVIKQSVSDIKQGAFVGVTGMPQPDGSQKAIEVHIFADVQRGTGDGHRPWDGAPNSTMTNGEVGTSVSGVEGPVITVKYKGGEKKIVVGPSTPIVKYIVSDKNELKQGASINITNAVKKPDGTFEAARVQVGRDGLVL
jgi:hypothetical protein